MPRIKIAFGILQVVSKVNKASGDQHKKIIDGIWEEKDDLWDFFQDGPLSDRFVLLEFIPHKIQGTCFALSTIHSSCSSLFSYQLFL